MVEYQLSGAIGARVGGAVAPLGGPNSAACWPCCWPAMARSSASTGSSTPCGMTSPRPKLWPRFAPTSRICVASCRSRPISRRRRKCGWPLVRTDTSSPCSMAIRSICISSKHSSKTVAPHSSAVRRLTPSANSVQRWRCGEVTPSASSPIATSRTPMRRAISRCATPRSKPDSMPPCSPATAATSSPKSRPPSHPTRPRNGCGVI